MKNKLANALVVVSIAMAFAACKKEGCTNSASYNFASKAKTDDGTCKFSTVIFKQDDSDIIAQGYDSTMTILTFDGTLLDTIHGNGSINKTLTDANTHTYSYDTYLYNSGFASITTFGGDVKASSQQSFTVDLY